MTYDLSVVIPGRREMFHAGTIEHLLENSRANTEFIAVLDGAWAKPEIKQHPRVNVIYVNKSIGQRAATNLGVRLSKAKYVMKLDAHCTWDEGCDAKMLEAFTRVGDDVTMVPIMRNLWMFDWKCMKCGKKWYQGPTPTKCQETNFKNTGKPCDSQKFKRKMMWVGKHNPQSTSFCFDTEPHFQYYEDYKHREPYLTDKKTGFTETLSLQGSCFMATREKYWELELCDERAGSWGNQGLEIACATWLTGGRVLVNHATWYSHMFRTQGGDFGFPYENRGNDVKRTKNYIRDKYWNKKHPKQIYPVSWLLDKFWPVPGWSPDDVQKIK